MSQLKIVKECVIQRSVDVCRAHFLDFEHHIEHGVHAGVHYTELERQGAKQKVRSRFKVLGLPKVDEVIVYADAEGTVQQEFVKGDFAGGRIEVRFQPEGAATRLVATLEVPLRGVNRALAPLLRRIVDRLTEATLAEDRRDLEGGYQPPEVRHARARAA
jgi:hypothetical protein